MTWEVEIKARVARPEDLLRLLSARHGAGREFFKRDRYYQKAGRPEFRLRLEEPGGINLVTLKEKTLSEGVETNREIEFKIDSVPDFEAFVNALGYRVSTTKEKEGRVWLLPEDTRIEFARVSRLGDYVEIECLVRDQAKLPEAEIKVKNLLASLEIPSEAIEPRFYNQLLEELEKF